jgi:hypothetical protein
MSGCSGPKTPVCRPSVGRPSDILYLRPNSSTPPDIADVGVNVSSYPDSNDYVLKAGSGNTGQLILHDSDSHSILTGTTINSTNRVIRGHVQGFPDFPSVSGRNGQ